MGKVRVRGSDLARATHVLAAPVSPGQRRARILGSVGGRQVAWLSKRRRAGELTPRDLETCLDKRQSGETDRPPGEGA